MKIIRHVNIVFQIILPLFLLSLCWAFQESALAASMPDYVRLESLTGGISNPTAVAVDRDGRLYVTQPGLDSVAVLSQGGKRIHTITGLAEPVSIAVADNGTIYIGNKGRGNVELFNSDFQPILNGNGLPGTLGAGEGEFTEPKDIAFDPAGNIYVVDKGDHVVRKYDSSGAILSIIGEHGNGDGQFNEPLSIAIDPATQHIIILDRQQVQDLYGDISGARIQFFSLSSGAYLNSVSMFGSNPENGDLKRPVHVEVDSLGRLYVTDVYFEEVKVYDDTGNFLGLLDDYSQPLCTPLGIAIATSNRLYVVSNFTERLDVFGLDDFTGLLVDPLSFTYNIQDGAGSTRPESITIANTGTAGFNWTSACPETWITLSTNGGTLLPGTSVELGADIQLGGLPPGAHQGSITIAAGGVAREVVDVTVNIQPNHVLSVTPGSLSFESNVGETPMFQTLNIENLGSGTLQWNGAIDQDWISMSAATGTAPSEIQVFADVSFRPAGTYTGNIIVSVEGVTNADPVTIPVMLTLTDPPPTIEPPPEVTPPPGTTWKGNHNMQWKVVEQVPGISLNGIWGSSVSDVFVAGESGLILHFDGLTWTSMDSGVTEQIHDVYGTSESEVFAVGDNGLILTYDGSGWNRIPPLLLSPLKSVWSGPDNDAFSVTQDGMILESQSPGQWMVSNYVEGTLRGVWGFSSTDMYAVGDNGLIVHYNGSFLADILSGTTEQLNDVWGSSASNIYAVGANGTILHFDGNAWSALESGTTATLTGIWGNSDDEVYVAGEGGVLMRYKGGSWYQIQTGVAEDLNDVWSGRAKEVYVVGADGSILYGHSAFPWLILRPALEHNAQQVRLMEEGDKQFLSE